MDVSSFNGWLGDGLRSDVGDPNGAVVSDSPFDPRTVRLTATPLRRVATSITSFDSASDYHKSSRLEVKGKIDIGIASASGRYTESRLLVRSANSSVIEANIDVEHSTYSLQVPDIRFTDAAVQHLIGEPDNDKVEAKFRRKYGDVFCTGLTLGGSLDASMIFESATDKSEVRKETVVKVKVLFVKKTYRNASFDASETEDLRISLAFADSTDSAGISYDGKPGSVSTSQHLIDRIARLSERVESYTPDLNAKLLRQFAANDPTDAVVSRMVDKSFVLRYYMTPFSSIVQYRELRALAYQQSVIRSESIRFFAAEAANLEAILTALAASARDAQIAGNQVNRNVQEILDEIRSPRVSQLPVAFLDYKSFWDLQISKQLLGVFASGEGGT